MTAGRVVGFLAVAAGAFALGLTVRRPWDAPPPAAHTSTRDTAPEPGAQKPLWTCGMHPQVVRDRPGNCPICGMELTPLRQSTGGAAGDAPGAVRIDPVMVQNMGVRVAPVGEGPLIATVRAVGTLEEVQPDQYDVNLRVSGWIDKLHAATEGMHLNVGDPLFDLYSPQLEVAVGELIGARKALATLPADAGTGARATAEALHRAAEQKLVLLGLPRPQVQQLARLDAPPRAITITSPTTGHLVARNVVMGAAVEAGQSVMRIVDHRELWLDGRVFEQQIALIAPGQHATAEVTALPGERFAGEVLFIHPHLDTMTRTATVRIRIPNPRLVLRPGMYGTVRIHVDAARSALLVPREAVIDTGTRKIVFVALGDGRFAPRDVATGLEGDGGRLEVLAGLSAGDQVVTSGQFLLDAESRLAEALHKYLHGGLLAPPATAAQQPARPLPPAAAPPAGPGGIPATDAVVRAYLDLTGALAARDAQDEAVPAESLVAAAGALTDGAPEPLRPTATRVRDAAAALAGQPLPVQRLRYGALSDAVIALVDAAPPSPAIGEQLLVMQCPMAEGRWLQTTRAVANPFYGTPMRQCGDVARTIR